jgi:lactobin A/cerein 7B family class IIb bacteriocin
MEKYLEPIELTDAELEAVAGGVSNSAQVAAIVVAAAASSGNGALNENEATAVFGVNQTQEG